MSIVASPDTVAERSIRTRDYVMCAPVHFGVRYRINPWMHPDRPVDASRAMAQWNDLVAIYLRLGHRLQFIEPAADCPDMVFAANAAVVIDGKAWVARFRHPERQVEEEPFRRWFEAATELDLVPSGDIVHEGQGDFLLVGNVLLAAHGFRTSREAHDLAGRYFAPGVDEVVSLRLVDPRWYHLDTALMVVDDSTVAYYPPAFDGPSRAILEQRFPDAVIADEHDAEWLGLNGASDGRHVVLPAQATGLHRDLAARGFDPIGIDLSELLAAGGSVRCCTLELATTGGLP